MRAVLKRATGRLVGPCHGTKQTCPCCGGLFGQVARWHGSRVVDGGAGSAAAEMTWGSALRADRRRVGGSSNVGRAEGNCRWSSAAWVARWSEVEATQAPRGQYHGSTDSEAPPNCRLEFGGGFYTAGVACLTGLGCVGLQLLSGAGLQFLSGDGLCWLPGHPLSGRASCRASSLGISPCHRPAQACFYHAMPGQNGWAMCRPICSDPNTQL